MNKNDLRNKMQSGFLEAAPDVYEAVLKAAEKNRLLSQDTEFQEIDEKNRLLSQDTESRKTKGLMGGSMEESTCKEQCASRKGNVIWGNFSKYALSACAGFALFFICLFGMLGKNEDSIYVVMDINPSIQIVLDESCQVRKLQGLNQDGKNVVEKLEWKEKDSLFYTIDVLLEDVVKESYLREGGGILVTVFAEDKALYQDLEKNLGIEIDGKLEDMGVSHVTTAFQYADGNPAGAGRTLLETQLAENFSADEQEVQQMTVMELIEYCQECIPGKLELSPSSREQQQNPSEQSKDGENSQRKELVPLNNNSEDAKNSAVRATSDVEDDTAKDEMDIGNDTYKADDKQQKSDEKKEAGQDNASQAELHNQDDDNDEQQDQKPLPTVQPAVQTQPESPSQAQPEPMQQEGISSESEALTKDTEDKKENKNKSNKKKNKNNKDKGNKKKDKNNKDKTNNKDNDNKDKNNKDNDKKVNNNKDNDNKVNNNKQNGKEVNNNRDNDNKVGNSRNSTNRNASSPQSR